MTLNIHTKHALASTPRHSSNRPKSRPSPLPGKSNFTKMCDLLLSYYTRPDFTEGHYITTSKERKVRGVETGGFFLMRNCLLDNLFQMFFFYFYVNQQKHE